jgi:hypothetical protein
MHLPLPYWADRALFEPSVAGMMMRVTRRARSTSGIAAETAGTAAGTAAESAAGTGVVTAGAEGERGGCLGITGLLQSQVELHVSRSQGGF